MTYNFKNFIRNWVLPPNITNLLQPKSILPNLQKYWIDAPVNIPFYEQQYFNGITGQLKTITREDDTRSSLTISVETVLPLPFGDKSSHLQFAVTADNWNDKSSLKIIIGDQVVEHTHLKSIHWESQNGRWLDLRIAVPSTAQNIIIKCNEVIHITMPRWVRVNRTTPSPEKKKISHVIVLVLDGGCKRILGKMHPTLGQVELTPNINRFFGQSFKATNCYSSSEWTFPSVTSLFTGQQTSKHHSFHPTKKHRISEENSLLAETFQSNGYHTACYSAANRLTPSYGFHRGFDRFIYHWALEGRTQNNYEPNRWISDVIGQLSTHRHDKTFTYMQLPDPHHPWNIPPLSRSYNLSREGSSSGLDLSKIKYLPETFKQSTQLEQLRVHDIDRELGALFSFIENNILDDTLVVLTADHGSAWEAFRPTHETIDEPTLVHDRLHIDLLIKGPEVPSIIYNDLCSPNIDLRPTLNSLMDFDNTEEFDGIDLLTSHTPRKLLISESVYDGVYEIAAIDVNRCLIKKFPFDEISLKITNHEFYSRLFRQGTIDYNQVLDEECPRLEDAIKRHISNPNFFKSSNNNKGAL